MKRKIGLILTVIIAMSLILGIEVTAMAATPPDGCPPYLNPCNCDPDVKQLFYVIAVNSENVKAYCYFPNGEPRSGPDFPAMSCFTDNGITPSVGSVYYNTNASIYMHLCPDNPPRQDSPAIDPILEDSKCENAPHTHDFVTGTIYDATCTTDGLEGTYCKTCGYVLNSSPIPAMGYTLETYAKQKIDAAKSGQKIVLEFGELNSFPKSFMEDVAAKVAAGVTFEFRYNWNHKLQKITIPAYCTVDTALDWYGPATMQQLYGAY